MSPRRTAPAKEQSGLPKWLVLAAIVAIALVVVIVGADFLTKLQANSAPQAAIGPTSVSTSGIVRSARTEGDPNAPINFVEYSDFQ